MLRGGTNQLRIERGRWEGEKVEDRVCRICLCDYVEDEQHFMLVCPMYVRERAKMFEEIRKKCIVVESIQSNEELMKILIGDGVGDQEITKRMRKVVSLYIRKAHKKRKRFESS